MGNNFGDEADATRRLSTGYLCLVKVYPGIYSPRSTQRHAWGVVTVNNGNVPVVSSGDVAGNSCQRAALQGIIDSLGEAGVVKHPDDILIDARGISSITQMTWEKLERWVTTGLKDNGRPPANLDLWGKLHGVLQPSIRQGKSVEFGLPFQVPKKKPGRPRADAPLEASAVSQIRKFREQARAAAQTHYRNNFGTVQKVGGRKKGTKNKR